MLGDLGANKIDGVRLKEPGHTVSRSLVLGGSEKTSVTMGASSFGGRMNKSRDARKANRGGDYHLLRFVHEH